MASFLLAQSDAVDPSVAESTTPITPKGIEGKPITKQYNNTGTINTPVKVKAEREYEIPSGESVTTTTTSSKGFPDIIPTLIPALQSSSYVLVILTAFVAWSSRKLFTDFLERHIELMGEVKANLEAERQANDKHLAVLSQLTENNKVLANSVDRAVSTFTAGINRQQ
jgi:hypothetical protein